MSLLKHLRRLLPRTRPNTITFEIGAEFLTPLEQLAARRRRLPGEVVADLITDAAHAAETDAKNQQHWEALTEREREIAALTCLGYSNREISQRLSITVGTVKWHLGNIRAKFDIHSKVELRRRLRYWEFSDWDY